MDQMSVGTAHHQQLKRAHSETAPTMTTTVAIHEPTLIRSNKRLRLTIKKPNTGASIATFTNCLATVQTSNEALTLLVHISDALQYNDCGDDLPAAVAQICAHFRCEQQSAVRVKVLALLAEFAATESGGIDGGLLVDEICGLMAGETAPKVLSQGLHSLYKIGNAQQLGAGVLTRIVEVARQQLGSYSHNIQRYALLVLAGFACVGGDGADTLELVGKYTDSQDSRVRAQALRSILTLGQRGVPLTPRLYLRTVQSLADDYECVRKEALQLVYELGVRNPEL